MQQEDGHCCGSLRALILGGEGASPRRRGQSALPAPPRCGDNLCSSEIADGPLASVPECIGQPAARSPSRQMPRAAEAGIIASCCPSSMPLQQRQPKTRSHTFTEETASRISAGEAATSSSSSSCNHLQVAQKNLSSRAPSVHFLKYYFRADVEAGGFAPDSSVYEIEADIIRARGSDVLCPRDGKLGAAYVDTLSNDENVGLATHFLSYAWGNSVQDIVDSLAAWQERRDLDPRRTNVWLCCLCENLHRPCRRDAIINPRTFAARVNARILGIGRVLALVGPWFAPLFVGRCWCLYELHIANQLLGDGGLEILMPPSEEEAFGRALRSGVGLHRILDALDGVKLENASASSEDRRCILSVVGECREQVNMTIVRRLQNGFKAIARKYEVADTDDGGLAMPMSPTVDEEEHTEFCDSWAVTPTASQRSNGDSGESTQKNTQDKDPEWEKALRIVDETTAEVSRLMEEVRSAPGKKKQALSDRKKFLLESEQYSAALRYLQDPIAESERRWAEHYGTVDLTSVLDDVPLGIPSEADDDGLELVECCVNKQSAMQACTIRKCAASGPSNNLASRPTLDYPERSLAKTNQGSCVDSTSAKVGSQNKSLFHL